MPSPRNSATQKKKGSEVNEKAKDKRKKEIKKEHLRMEHKEDRLVGIPYDCCST